VKFTFEIEQEIGYECLEVPRNESSLLIANREGNELEGKEMISKCELSLLKQSL
jgi:hypothetical protein